MAQYIRDHCTEAVGRDALSKVFKKTYGFPPGRISRFFRPQ